MGTGPMDGAYNTWLFDKFNQNVMNVSGRKFSLKRIDPTGTDGTSWNTTATANNEVNVAFVQGEGPLLIPGNYQVIGKIQYEAAMLVVKTKGKKDTCDDLEDSPSKMGLNTMGGTGLTVQYMGKQDKDYAKNIAIEDYAEAAMGIAGVLNGDIDAYFYVSSPFSATTKMVNDTPGVKFGNCWDSNFNDYKINGASLYKKIKIGKKQGLKKTVKTFSTATYVIANKDFLAQNSGVFTYLFKATGTTFKNLSAMKVNKWWPKQ
jgi:hypothetical protein